jgi:hypothetical protein
MLPIEPIVQKSELLGIEVGHFALKAIPAAIEPFVRMKVCMECRLRA